jgi:hypothetical protein
MDNYIVSSWQYEVNSELDPFVKKTFSNEDRGYIEIQNIINSSDFIKNGETQKLVEVRDRLTKPIEITLVIKRTFDENMSNDEFKKMFECIQFIKEKNYRPDKLSINYIVRTDDTYKGTFKYTRFEMNNQDLKSISSSDEIKNYRRK